MPNIGVLTGPASDLLVLDVDPDNGGDETLAALVAKHGELPSTYTVRTGSGGLHYYFRHPEGLRNSAGRLGAGLDTRGDGGMVVAPPSVSGKGPYSVVDDADVVEMPAWMLDLLTTRSAPVALTPPGEAAPISNRWTAAAVAGELGRLDAMRTAATTDGAGYKGQPWDATTYAVACRLVELSNGNPVAYPLDWAHGDLLGHAPTDDDFTFEQVEAKWDSARSKVGDKAAAPLPPLAPAAPLPERGVGHPAQLDGAVVLDAVRAHFALYVKTMNEADLDLLTLWAGHTHFVDETYTTPRLVLDSPMPGSGKTTVLEHLSRLCVDPCQMASVTSTALLARILDTAGGNTRTLLIDEVDRTLSPDNPLTTDLLAVLNSGYKKGGTRPVLVPVDGDWEVKEMPTYAPVAMSGNNPNLPEDTRQRTIRVLLMPDREDSVEDSDWEMIEDDVRALGALLARWAEQERASVRAHRPRLPDGVKGRNKERWSPLKRVAHAAGERWSVLVDVMAVDDLASQVQDREDGLITERPAVLLLKHMHEAWAPGETFVPSEDLIARLIAHHPESWGAVSSFGKPLTAHRLGRMLVQAYKLNSARPDSRGPRGYVLSSVEVLWHRLGIVGASPTPLSGSGAAGASGGSGAADDIMPNF